MGMIWSLFATLWNFLPWVAIGLMAGAALHRRKESRLLMLQAGGACAMFLLGAAQWVIVDFLLPFFRATYAVTHFAQDIFAFLLFIALSAFAVGYCGERMSRRHQAIQVSATRAD